MKDQITSLIRQALAAIPAANLPSDATNAAIELERTRDPAHGDFASSIALRLAKAARRNPRELAQTIVAALPASDLIAKAEVAGAGFINFHLAPTAYARELERIAARRRALWSLQLGRRHAGAGGVRVLESHRAAACRARTPCGLWRDACQSAVGHRFRRPPRVLRERCRAPDGYPGGECVAALPGTVRGAFRVSEQRLSRRVPPADCAASSSTPSSAACIAKPQEVFRRPAARRAGRRQGPVHRCA